MARARRYATEAAAVAAARALANRTGRQVTVVCSGVPEQHRRKIAAQDARMPEALRAVMSPRGKRNPARPAYATAHQHMAAERVKRTTGRAQQKARAVLADIKRRYGAEDLDTIVSDRGAGRKYATPRFLAGLPRERNPEYMIKAPSQRAAQHLVDGLRLLDDHKGARILPPTAARPGWHVQAYLGDFNEAKAPAVAMTEGQAVKMIRAGMQQKRGRLSAGNPTRRKSEEQRLRDAFIRASDRAQAVARRVADMTDAAEMERGYRSLARADEATQRALRRHTDYMNQQIRKRRNPARPPRDGLAGRYIRQEFHAGRKGMRAVTIGKKRAARAKRR